MTVTQLLLLCLYKYRTVFVLLPEVYSKYWPLAAINKEKRKLLRHKTKQRKTKIVETGKGTDYRTEKRGILLGQKGFRRTHEYQFSITKLVHSARIFHLPVEASGRGHWRFSHPNMVDSNGTGIVD